MQNDDLVPVSIAAQIRLDIHAAGLESISRSVFASERDEIVWWTTPHPLLDGIAPRIAAQSQQGPQRVRNVLLGFKYGSAV